MIIKESGTTNTEYLMLKISFQIQVMILSCWRPFRVSSLFLIPRGYSKFEKGTQARGGASEAEAEKIQF